MKYLDKWLGSPFEISLPTFPVKHESASRIFGEALDLPIVTMSKCAASKPICPRTLALEKSKKVFRNVIYKLILIYRIVLGAR